MDGSDMDYNRYKFCNTRSIAVQMNRFIGTYHNIYFAFCWIKCHTISTARPGTGIVICFDSPI